MGCDGTCPSDGEDFVEIEDCGKALVICMGCGDPLAPAALLAYFQAQILAAQLWRIGRPNP